MYFQQAICSHFSDASSIRSHGPTFCLYLKRISPLSVSLWLIFHTGLPFEVSGTRYAIKEVLHLYLMPLLAKGIRLRERLEKKEGRREGDVQSILISSGET